MRPIGKAIMRMGRGWLQELRARAYVESHWHGVILEPGVHIKGALANLHLAEGVQLQSGTVLHLGGMPWCENAGCIAIGEGSVISPNCVIYGCGPGGVSIGNRFDCGSGVGIFSSRTAYLEGPGHHLFAPVRIGDDVTVFSNVVISPGVVIGDGAVIAAGSVVTENIPGNCLVGGAPAKVIRKIREASNVRHKRKEISS